MEPIKVLNLYAGIGGNRKLWDNVEVTAVELNQYTAAVYSDFYPDDDLIIGDAHQYLKDNFNEFDFIWTSPPCQTHASFRQNICVRFRGSEAKYPDMKLYQEIIFLENNFKGLWCVENVKPYYRPLIPPTTELQRHYFWSNFLIRPKGFGKENLRDIQIPDLEKLHGFDLSGKKLPDKRQVLRNCVLPELGKHIFDCAAGTVKKEEQLGLFV